MPHRNSSREPLFVDIRTGREMARSDAPTAAIRFAEASMSTRQRRLAAEKWFRHPERPLEFVDYYRNTVFRIVRETVVTGGGEFRIRIEEGNPRAYPSLFDIHIRDITLESLFDAVRSGSMRGLPRDMDAAEAFTIVSEVAAKAAPFSFHETQPDPPMSKDASPAVEPAPRPDVQPRTPPLAPSLVRAKFGTVLLDWRAVRPTLLDVLPEAMQTGLRDGLVHARFCPAPTPRELDGPEIGPLRWRGTSVPMDVFQGKVERGDIRHIASSLHAFHPNNASRLTALAGRSLRAATDRDLIADVGLARNDKTPPHSME